MDCDCKHENALDDHPMKGEARIVREAGRSYHNTKQFTFWPEKQILGKQLEVQP